MHTSSWLWSCSSTHGASILQAADPNTFASLALVGREWRRLADNAAFYAHHLRQLQRQLQRHRDPATPPPSPAPDDDADSRAVKKKFLVAARRNLFDVYFRPRTTHVNLVSTAAASASALPTGDAFGFAFSTNGERLLCLGSCMIYCLDLTVEPIRVCHELRTLRRPTCAAILDNGSLLAVVSSNLRANIYALGPRHARLLQSFAISERPRALALAPDGSVLAVAYDDLVEVHALGPDVLESDRRAVRCGDLDSLAFSSDGSMLMGSSLDPRKNNFITISPPFIPDDEPDQLRRMWTSQMLFPDVGVGYSHATIIPPRSCDQGGIWLAGYDADLKAFRLGQVDDVSPGITYFVGPGRDGADTDPEPTVVPAADTSGDLLAIGFRDSGIWLYGTPDSFDHSSSLCAQQRRQRQRQQQQQQQQQKVEFEQKWRTTTQRTNSQRLKKVLDLPRYLVYGHPLTTANDITAIHWVRSASLSRRLVAVAPGGVSGGRLSDGPVDGGRILIYDFERAPVNGEKRESTLEVGGAPPIQLQETATNLDLEVELARRRTTVSRVRRLNMPSCHSTSIPSPSVYSPGLSALSTEPLQRQPRQPPVLRPATYVDYSATTRSSLSGPGTSGSRPRTRIPPHESDADNWVPPPPPYSKEADGPLPEELARTLLPQSRRVSSPVGQVQSNDTPASTDARSTRDTVLSTVQRIGSLARRRSELWRDNSRSPLPTQAQRRDETPDPTRTAVVPPNRDIPGFRPHPLLRRSSNPVASASAAWSIEGLGSGPDTVPPLSPGSSAVPVQLQLSGQEHERELRQERELEEQRMQQYERELREEEERLQALEEERQRQATRELERMQQQERSQDDGVDLPAPVSAPGPAPLPIGYMTPSSPPVPSSAPDQTTSRTPVPRSGSKPMPGPVSVSPSPLPRGPAPQSRTSTPESQSQSHKGWPQAQPLPNPYFQARPLTPQSRSPPTSYPSPALASEALPDPRQSPAPHPLSHSYSHPASYHHHQRAQSHARSSPKSSSRPHSRTSTPQFFRTFEPTPGPDLRTGIATKSEAALPRTGPKSVGPDANRRSLALWRSPSPPSPALAGGPSRNPSPSPSPEQRQNPSMRVGEVNVQEGVVPFPAEKQQFDLDVSHGSPALDARPCPTGTAEPVTRQTVPSSPPPGAPEQSSAPTPAPPPAQAAASTPPSPPSSPPLSSLVSATVSAPFSDGFADGFSLDGMPLSEAVLPAIADIDPDPGPGPGPDPIPEPQPLPEPKRQPETGRPVVDKTPPPPPPPPPPWQQHTGPAPTAARTYPGPASFFAPANTTAYNSSSPASPVSPIPRIPPQRASLGTTLELAMQSGSVALMPELAASTSRQTTETNTISPQVTLNTIATTDTNQTMQKRAPRPSVTQLPPSLMPAQKPPQQLADQTPARVDAPARVASPNAQPLPRRKSLVSLSDLASRTMRRRRSGARAGSSRVEQGADAGAGMNAGQHSSGPKSGGDAGGHTGGLPDSEDDPYEGEITRQVPLTEVIVKGDDGRRRPSEQQHRQPQRPVPPASMASSRASRRDSRSMAPAAEPGFVSTPDLPYGPPPHSSSSPPTDVRRGSVETRPKSRGGRRNVDRQRTSPAAAGLVSPSDTTPSRRKSWRYRHSIMEGGGSSSSRRAGGGNDSGSGAIGQRRLRRAATTSVSMLVVGEERRPRREYQRREYGQAPESGRRCVVM